MKTILKTIVLLLLSLLFIHCKPEPIEPEPIDYRDKWCGFYDFSIRYINESVMENNCDTTFYDSGKVYYTADMDEDEINIDIDYFSNQNPIHIDKNGNFIFYETETRYEGGSFVNNDSLYYSYWVMQVPNGISYSYYITGIKP